MSSLDDQVSEVTESSSGICDSHVTILNDEKLQNFVSEIENELKNKSYFIPIPPAGRGKLENRISQIKHSMITVIIFTKKDDSEFRNVVESLATAMSSVGLGILSTIVLYENGIKPGTGVLSQHYVHLKFPNDPIATAGLISGYIEASRMAKDYNSTDVKSFRDFYSELLLHSIINPLMSSEPFQIKYEEMSRKFAEKYGAFKHLLTGSLKQRLKNSSNFKVQDENVLQCESGALTSHFWSYQMSFVSSNVTLHKEKIIEAPIRNNTNENIESLRQRTKQWVDKLDVNDDNADAVDLDWNEASPLQKLLPEFSLRYSFFLISGKCTPPDKYKGIVNIPWLKAFDFNTESKSEGLFSSVEKFWKNSRYFSLSTCSTPLKNLSTDSTDWFFPLGYSGMAETLFSGSPLAWFNDNKLLLEKQFSSIANFCAVQTVPVFVILWYDPDKNNVKYLNWILSVLYPAFNSDVMSKKVVLCNNQASDKNNSLQEVISTYELESTTVHISAETVYKFLASQSVPAQPQQDVVNLPTKQGIKEISDKVFLLWIQQYIEILPFESQEKIASRKTKDFGKDFVKGSTISWDELASEKLAVQRDGKKDVYECLKSDVFDKQKSVVLRIQHAPGGGGTTFARQLLWDLHFKLPCGVVVPNLTLSIAEISEGVRQMNELTKLPVVLLIDGRSEFEIDQIFEKCKYAIVILHVQRYSKKIPKNEFLTSSRTCRLPGLVTSEEAGNLTKVFSSFSPKSIKTLKKLTIDVKNNKDRFVFEYGLAAFNHEFKGVRKYVQGYLKLHEQKEGVENLLDWQRVIGYLSLALFYGQSGMHRETFRGLLKAKTFVSLKHLDYSGSQFIVETKGEWKISYNIVAKEILEQILSSCTRTPTEQCVPEMSNEAKINLHELVKDFINMIKTASKGNVPETLIQLLTNMIIRRDYSEVDKNDGIAKGVLSNLLEDLPIQQDRVDILKLLTEAFPFNAEFHAHLGRLLNIMKKFALAEESLQRALEIRSEECLHWDIEFGDDMLSRIHHMFGVGYSKRAQEERKRAKKGRYQNMLKYVKKAVDHFREARRYATHNLSYGFNGEIHVRLLLAEFVEEKFSAGCQGAFDFKLGPNHLELSEFVRNSHSVCDTLLAESLHYSTEQELERVRTYTECIERFNALYGCIKHNLFKRSESNLSIAVQRSEIAFLKMVYRTNDKRPSIENVRNVKDLEKIITLYESIFRQVFGGNNKHESISVDVLEWLEAIRHPLAPDEYSLVRILQTVQNWVKKKEPGYATFYLYVVNFALAVFSAGENLNKQYYNKALELKERLRLQKYKCNVKFWRLEWIAKYEKAISIRKLINLNRLGVWDKDIRFWKDKEAAKKLQVFTGTVTHSHHPLKGTISLDVVQSHYKCPIDVYFVPKLYNLDKRIYAEQKTKVEFCIGFSIEHGAEAYAVKTMDAHVCLNCKMKTEFITINEPPSGICSVCGAHPEIRYHVSKEL